MLHIQLCYMLHIYSCNSAGMQVRYSHVGIFYSNHAPCIMVFNMAVAYITIVTIAIPIWSKLIVHFITSYMHVCKSVV